MYGGRCHGERLGRLDLESGSSNTSHCRAFTAIGDYSRVSDRERRVLASSHKLRKRGYVECRSFSNRSI